MVPSFAGLVLDRPRLMGVVNVTPDSFADGGLTFDHMRAIEHGLRLRGEGADIIDVGGESSRPGAAMVDPQEELRRVLPVVQGLVRHGALVSIDSRNAVVMRAAVDAGAAIVNDVSALRDDPASLQVVAETRIPVILMHRRGTSSGRFVGPAYDDVVAEVKEFLLRRITSCLSFGIAREAIALDPGIGFGKSVDENLRLVLGLQELVRLGRPTMVGASLKGFIGRLTGEANPRDRVGGSLTVALEAARRGAKILRVHDVAATRQALQVARAFDAVENGGSALPTA